MALPSPGPITRFGVFFLVGGVALIFAGLAFLQHVDRPAHPAKVSQVKMSAERSTATGPAATATPTPAAPVDPAAVARLTETISQAMGVLRDPANSGKREALKALREVLRQADGHVAVKAIRQFLDGGEDAATGLKFKLGDGHSLEDAPSLRTFLMDELGAISLGIGAADAAEVARATLATKGSADEWAIAMRNLGQADPDGSKALLAAKARELIGYEPWRSAPTGGYFEAFDAAAFAGDPAVINELAPLSSTQTAAGRAAQIALQRLSGMAPDRVAAFLNANPVVLADAPLRRADYMGSVDLSQPAQVTQAETYLNRADVSEPEKTKFLARLGLPAGFVSDTLLTPETITQGTIFEHRAVVNQAAANWLSSGKFPALQGSLQKLVTQTAAKPGG